MSTRIEQLTLCEVQRSSDLGNLVNVLQNRANLLQGKHGGQVHSIDSEQVQIKLCSHYSNQPCKERAELTVRCSAQVEQDSE